MESYKSRKLSAYHLLSFPGRPYSLQKVNTVALTQVLPQPQSHHASDLAHLGASPETSPLKWLFLLCYLESTSHLSHKSKALPRVLSRFIQPWTGEELQCHTALLVIRFPPHHRIRRPRTALIFEACTPVVWGLGNSQPGSLSACFNDQRKTKRKLIFIASESLSAYFSDK